MRAPAAVLVVDAAVLIKAAFGRSSPVVRKVGTTRILLTTERAVQEARRRIELGLKRPDLLAAVDALMASIAVVPTSEIEADLPGCERTLKEAVDSRNGSVQDAHILALARAADADIWSADRDFAGAGVATWSTHNLVRGLATPA